ncbi:tetratricopeptide repeat protein [Micromonospora sp. SCSIO 07396]
MPSLLQRKVAAKGSAQHTQDIELEIFAQTSTYYELRLSVDGQPPRTRSLDRAAVDELIALVRSDYSSDVTAQRVYGAARLAELGSRLAEFLDGDERWLTPILAGRTGAVLRITAEQRLRHLPWELLARQGAFLTVAGRAPLLPVRTVGTHAALTGPVAPGNRPLRVLFMAASPEGVEPVLNFEAEEAAILAATRRTGTDLVVEESGSLEGLRFLSRDYGPGYFDVLHLSGHATTAGGQPVFLLEDEYGAPTRATVDQLAEAMQGHWPRLVFVSGCLTADAPEGGVFPSMSESLVAAGAPAVLGWALPVGDVSATDFAAALYRALADGGPLDRAVVEARRHLFHDKKSSYWHLLRVYADRSPLAPLVTPLHTKGRRRLQVRAADQQFLDPQTQLSRVAARAEFVGRRRVIQRCLRALRQPADTPGATQGLLLAGMGGLGKSSLASRLLERMPTHQRAVWYGRVDAIKFRELIDKVRFDDVDQRTEAAKLLDNEQLPLPIRLRYLLDVDGPLGGTPCLFVFDDFNTGNLDTRDDGSRVLAPAMAEILPALLAAIRDTGSPSRVIITSRYRFPTPPGTTLTVEALDTLTPVEQRKIANLTNLRPESRIDPTIRSRAIEAAAGNPRLLDWLNRIVNDATLDVDGLLAAIEGEADRFRRETVLADNLLDSQPLELRRMLARINVVELPVPAATVHALHPHPDAARHLQRAVELGLLEEGTDPETREPRYYVSNILHPLVRPLLTDDDYTQACADAAQSLYQLWILNPTGQRLLARWVEVHRLAVAGQQAEIARDIGGRTCRFWLRTSRFATVEAMATATLTLGPDADALYQRGLARSSTGRPWPALEDYQQALTMYQQAGDQGNEAATLTNIGRVYDGLGDRQRALDHYHQALPIRREVGDRAGEAATLNNIGRVYDGLGDRQRALDHYHQALPIRREVGDRAGEAATLTNIGRVYDGLGDRQRALDHYHQALPIRREVGDRAGEAATLNNIGRVYDGLGDRQRALDHYHQALPIRREVGDRAGEAATLNNIGRVYDGLGDRQRALDHYHQALPIRREVGDRAGEAATLTNIGRVYDGLGDRQRALDHYHQALPIQREVGDRAGEAATLTNIGRVYDGLGDRQRALDHYHQALPIQREVGDRAGEAATLTNIGRVYDGLGDRQRALDHYHQALPIQREVGDRAGEAATLTNIGRVYHSLGDRQRALDHYHQALPIQRDVGDRAGEAVTRYNIAMVHRANGDLDQAIRELEHVVDLDRQVGHPDLEADTALLEKVRQEQARSRNAT